MSQISDVQVKDESLYWDHRFKRHTIKLLPGDFDVVNDKTMLVTVLGSCVAACIRDVRSGIGGMNHFMLPMNKGVDYDDILSDAARYGNFAMEHLINDIIRNGGQRQFLEFKLFGGGKIMQAMMDVGRKNIEFVLHYLETEGFKAIAEDLGDDYPRKVVYFPKTGKVRMKKLKSMHNDTIIKRETSYVDKLKVEPVQGDIELF